ncbi:MAG: helix-turn-helix domain-containing protein [Mesorhizobium sp.]|nr:MAG: helix-turn-helix domain-containing protein [Mesorhizobium sp.]
MVTRQAFVTNLAQFRCERSSATPMMTVRREIVGTRMNDMKNGIRLFRERKKMSISELARRVGVTRQHMGRLESSKRKLTSEWAVRIAPHLETTPQELIFPNIAKADLNRFQSVFEIAGGDGAFPSEPSISIQQDLLANLMPGATSHKLQLVIVDNDDMNRHIGRGDAVIVDLDNKTATRPGIYALRIAGELQLRFLSPTTSGTILVRSDNPNIPEETAKPGDLSIIGRARLKISTI